MSISSNPRLVNLSNNEIFDITSAKISVGRSLKADLVVIGQSISRIHFTIGKKNEVWTIQDHSTNGTRINNILLKSASTVLTTGDVINFLDDTISFKFEMPSNPSPTTNSEPNPDFIVSEINGSEVPSVSNDHDYPRRLLPEGPIDLTSPSSSRGAKRKKEMPEEVPAKKLFTEPQEPSKPLCILEQSELECSICQELFIMSSTLNCSHSFCKFCIYRWKDQRDHCPICRKPIKSINPSILLDNFVKKLVESMDDESKEQREKMIKERSKVSVNPSSSKYQPMQDSDVVDLDEEEEEDDDDTFDDEDGYDDDDEEFFIDETDLAWTGLYPDIITDYYY